MLSTEDFCMQAIMSGFSKSDHICRVSYQLIGQNVTRFLARQNTLLNT